MPAPQGNTYAKGNAGGGRKSAYEEQQDAEWLQGVWNDPQVYSELQNKIEVEKVYSARDMMLWKALNGSDAILKTMADKMLASKTEIDMLHTQGPDPEGLVELSEGISIYLREIEAEAPLT